MTPRKLKPTKAAALEYKKEEHPAPVLAAKGQGLVAQRIIELAQAADIPVFEDAALVSALLALQLGENIPEDLFEAVAKVLAFIYRLDRGDVV